MLVVERMSRPVVTITGKAAVKQALEIMEERKLRHLPVLDDKDTLVGIVSEKDLLRAEDHDRIAGVMTTDVITVTEYSALEEAARKTGLLP